MQFMIIGVQHRVSNLETATPKLSQRIRHPHTQSENQVFSATSPKQGQHRKQNSFLPYFLIFTCYFLFPQAARAILAPQTPLFENITIRPGFQPDPATIRGISGGSERASDIAGRQETANGPCVGFVTRNPSHTLVLNAPFNYLRLQVQSPDDTTLVISGPGGTWCNDDQDKKNAGISGQWLPGTYRIWVGSYQKDKYTPYVIRITQVQ